jgi:hypothetical protein
VQTAALDYLALGDWHGYVSLSARVNYSGTPETDSFASKEPGVILIVDIQGEALPPKIEPLTLTTHHWAKLEHVVLPGTGVDDIIALISKTDIPRHQTLVRLKLRGQLPVSEYTSMKMAISRARESFAYFEADLSALHPILDVDDLDDLDLAGSLRHTAENLITIKSDQSLAEQDRHDAARALDLLLTYSQEAG